MAKKHNFKATNIPDLIEKGLYPPKKTSPKTPPEPIEKIVYLRVSPEDYEIIVEMKKEFYEATVNQSVIRGLHNWQKLKKEVKDLQDNLMSLRAERDQYYNVIRETAEGLIASQTMIQAYKKMIKP